MTTALPALSNLSPAVAIHLTAAVLAAGFRLKGEASAKAADDKHRSGC